MAICISKTVRFYIAAVWRSRNAELSMVSNNFLDTTACTLQPYRYRENGETLSSYMRKNSKDKNRGEIIKMVKDSMGSFWQ